MPATSINVRRFQKALLQAARELDQLDGRLATLADTVQPEFGRALPGELRGGVHCVRTDLLRDAIETLETLARATEEGVTERRLEIGVAIERIATFG